MKRRTGIVLAGGLGRRLGLGVPKAQALLGGRTLLDRAIGTLTDACAEVFVMAPAGLDLGPVAVTRVHDAPGFEGPLAGLVAGLEAAGEPSCLVLGVDFPCAGRDVLEALAEKLESGAGALEAVVPRPDGIPQPLVAAYAAAAAPKLRAALESGERSLRGGLEALLVEWVEGAALDALPGGREALLNVNTPDDLERARRRLNHELRRVS